ncbi:hypothetical protein C725_3022 [Pacificimonas flava]|uniref:Uncharacterized protein n=1 Tax=Pacificimonas flava TaxID=1234595 RepID=M2T549_9SPHN|nr:hypothetical protein C725_3022 [Pacificimonas flava]
MLRTDPELRRAFEERLAADPAFAGDPDARLQWFADRSPHLKSGGTVYPIKREAARR